MFTTRLALPIPSRAQLSEKARISPVDLYMEDEDERGPQEDAAGRSRGNRGEQNKHNKTIV